MIFSLSYHPIFSSLVGVNSGPWYPAASRRVVDVPFAFSPSIQTGLLRHWLRLVENTEVNLPSQFCPELFVISYGAEYWNPSDISCSGLSIIKLCSLLLLILYFCALGLTSLFLWISFHSLRWPSESFAPCETSVNLQVAGSRSPVCAVSLGAFGGVFPGIV